MAGIQFPLFINFFPFFCRCSFLHHSLQVQCLWSFNLKSPLFFSVLPYFVVYCCGPMRLRSKHSWSLGYPFPLLLHLWPSCFCRTFLWCSPPLLKRFLTVSSVLLYLLSKCHHCQYFNGLISFNFTWCHCATLEHISPCDYFHLPAPFQGTHAASERDS